MMTGSKLTKKDYMLTTMRAYYLQNGFNYSNYQGLGYANVMYPALRKVYENDEAFAAAITENCEFYNTNPSMLPFITSIHLVMADSGMKYSEIRGIKMALMGPLAGIGDSLSQFCIAPLFSTIFASLAMDGVAAAPLLFLFTINIVLLGIKVGMGLYGYKLGTSIIDKLSERMAIIADVANIIGVTVISGLAATFVKMNVGITFAAGAIEEGANQSSLNIQAMLDKVSPALLPMLYTILMYYLIKKKGWTTYKLVIITVIVGIVASYFNILS